MFKLPVTFAKHHAAQSMSHATDLSTFSGIELESPHKDLVLAHEFPCHVSDIGEVRSLWVGHKGVNEIVQMRAKEREEVEVSSKSQELRKLARECLLALQEAGLAESDSAQVRKATKLCKLYHPQNVSDQPRDLWGCSISRLWRNNDHVGSGNQEQAGISVAETVLGDELVEKVTEKNRSPPDVSFCLKLPCMCLYSLYLVA